MKKIKESIEFRDFDILEVYSNIKESGTTNEFVSKIEKIFISNKTPMVALIMNDGADFIIDLNTCEVSTRTGDYKINKDGIGLNSLEEFKTHERLSGRTVVNYLDIEGKYIEGSLYFYRIIGIIQDIIDNNGNTRESYIGLEVNHKIPRIYKTINCLSNLEVCTETQNKRHFAAWNKIEGIRKNKKEYFALELSALDDELINFILNKNTFTENYNFDEKYIILSNKVTNEYCVFTEVDGVYKHQKASGIEIDTEWRKI